MSRTARLLPGLGPDALSRYSGTKTEDENKAARGPGWQNGLTPAMLRNPRSSPSKTGFKPVSQTKA